MFIKTKMSFEFGSSTTFYSNSLLRWLCVSVCVCVNVIGCVSIKRTTFHNLHNLFSRCGPFQTQRQICAIFLSSRFICLRLIGWVSEWVRRSRDVDILMMIRERLWRVVSVTIMQYNDMPNMWFQWAMCSLLSSPNRKERSESTLNTRRRVSSLSYEYSQKSQLFLLNAR